MTFKRVNKSVARRMYNMGFEVKLLPCKVNSAIALDPTAQGHFWVNPSTIKQDSPTSVQLEDKSFKLCADSTFDRLVNTYTYYNCNAELGYYPHYFVSEEDHIKYKESVINGIKEKFEKADTCTVPG